MESYHPAEFEKTSKKITSEIEQENTGNGENSTNIESTPSLSHKAKQITEAIARMMILDFQPFSLVEDAGFKRLMRVVEPRYQLPSRKYFSTTVLPKLYQDTIDQIQFKIKTQGSYFSCTTDLWESLADESYISLTLHYINDHYKRISIVLGAFEFPLEHTAKNISEIINGSLNKWNLDSKQIRCFVHDNARNMIASMRESNFESILCVNHTIQLAIKDASRRKSRRFTITY